LRVVRHFFLQWGDDVRLQKEIAEAFEKNAMEWLTKDLDKHKHYLTKVAFGRTIPPATIKDVDKTLAQFNADPGQSVRELYGVLKPSIERQMETIHKRGLALADKYNDGHITIEDKGIDSIIVQSETSANNTYTVSLSALTCTCPYYEKVKFAGMLCKHIFLADEILGDKYRNTQNKPAEAKVDNPQPERMDPVITDSSFCYGSQSLAKKERRGNPHIPSVIYYMLEGRGPEMAMYALNNNETLLLIGESGVGKSKLIHYLAQETNTPLLNACGHNEITVENLLGAMTVINGNTIWKYGILPEAMRRGYWLLLDEINSIDPGVTKVINELLDNRKITITVAGEPRLVKAHRNFRLVCTMNPPDSPIYKGIETMSFELMDRFDTVVYMDYLSSSAESRLIMETSGFSDEVVATKIVQFATTIRQAMRQGEIFATVTTRSLISFCRKAQHFDVRTAAETSILRKMSKADRDKASDIFNAIFR